MLKVIETFSGIGAQAKALQNIGVPHKIIGTADWDINAIIAYDLIHNGPQDIENSQYANSTREEMIDRLKGLTLSTDGKSAADAETIKRLNIGTLQRVCYAIDRTKNYVSVTDMNGALLPSDMDMLTYSFPCQDLSVAHAWHGRTDGIDRSAGNRSSMLWQIERILKEREASTLPMPKFLLMENVPNIMSGAHNKNFEEWQASLRSLGYYNKAYRLTSSNFGSRQMRKRAYLISVYVGNDESLKKSLDRYFLSNNLEERFKKSPKGQKPLSEYLRTDYTNPDIKAEADASQPNDTISRRRIFEDNLRLFDGVNTYADLVPTITTKQDRHPNSGVISYPRSNSKKADYRYLTGRECLLLMGFEDKDYEAIMAGNFKKNVSDYFFSNNKIIKFAGNSIVVPVLEEVFRQINEIDQRFLANPRPVKQSSPAIITTSPALDFAI